MIGAARLFWTGAIIAGGVYLYRKAKNGQSELAAHAAGIIVGDKVGTITGYALATGLVHYSQLGAAYIGIVRNVITRYQFNHFA